jgi:hypothetical protein
MKGIPPFQVIQRAVQAEIYRSDFEFELPQLAKLESWDPLTNPNLWHSKEQLEFVGDSLMNTCIGLELHDRFPGESPHFYTVGVLRSPLDVHA